MKLPLFFICANLCGLVLAFQFGFVGLANRLENQSILADQRKPIAEITMHAIEANLPMGVGLGAFGPIYQMFELPAVATPTPVIHAHDDWLELGLDGGLPALVLIFAFLLWYAYASVRTWRGAPRAGSAIDRALARAGPFVVGLLLLHSTVDYPLRTTSLMVVFAFGAALMISPAELDQLSSDPARRSQPLDLDLLVPWRRRALSQRKALGRSNAHL
jgi:O-antigen ligase